MISALYSQAQSLRSFIVLELDNQGPMRSVMVARMRCKARGGREQGQPWAWWRPLTPSPLFPTFTGL